MLGEQFLHFNQNIKSANEVGVLGVQGFGYPRNAPHNDAQIVPFLDRQVDGEV